MSGDATKDFLAGGIAESLISSLAALPSVTVLSRASVTEARGRIKDQAALIKDLGASYLVEGSVQESGGTIHVSLNLVRADRSVAWGDTVEGKFEQIFELQSRLASALTTALVVRLSASDRERMIAQPTMNADALSAYWQGKALLERADVQGNIDAAVRAFGQASRLDPKFALAHAGLGEAYRRKYSDTRDPSWAERAIDEATSALRLDPDRAEVRYVLALTLAGGGRLAEAVEELNRALAIRPNYEDARRQLGTVLAEQGSIDMAIAEFRKAIALRPSATAPYSDMGRALVAALRYQEAADVFEELIAIAPDNASAYQQLGTAYQYLGRSDDALLNYQKAIAIRPSAPAYSNMGAFLHRRGDFTGAVDAYKRAIAIRPNSAATRRNLGDALTKLGRREEAKSAYLEAVRLGEADLKVNPSDPRILAAQAVYLQKAGDHAGALIRLNDALKKAPESAEVLYRASVVRSLRGDKEQALAALESAVKKGYSRDQILTDDDFATLRTEVRFKQLTSLEVR